MLLLLSSATAPLERSSFFLMAVSPFWQVSDNPTAVDDRGPIATRTNTFFTDAESVAKGGSRHWAAVASWT
jgi:hypothetical protein